MEILEAEAVAVTVHLTREDCELLNLFAAHRWPEQTMSQEEILLAVLRKTGGCMLRKLRERQAE